MTDEENPEEHGPGEMEAGKGGVSVEVSDHVAHVVPAGADGLHGIDEAVLRHHSRRGYGEDEVGGEGEEEAYDNDVSVVEVPVSVGDVVGEGGGWNDGEEGEDVEPVEGG